MDTKRTISRFISFLLLIAMLLSNTTGVSFAIDTSHDPASGSITTTHINPEYAHLNIELPTLKPGVSTLSDAPAFDSFEEAGAYLRDQMERRADAISVTINGYVTDYNEDTIKADWRKILDAAFVHTGDPTEGDYLNRHYGGCSGSMSWDGTFSYLVNYHTTAVQETEMDTAVAELLANWESEYDIYNLSDYEKICIVYDYICANVTYDYDNLYDDSYMLKYSAYAALINGTAVCQGYASLFYRLALTMGVDARFISGIGNGGSHGWNIVDMGDYYYYLDATWDAGQSVYQWFLRGSEYFPDHMPDEEYLTEEFTAQYPIDTQDYVHPTPDEPDGDIIASGECGAEGDNLTWTLTEDGTLTISGEGKMANFEVNAQPWYDYRSNISAVIIEDGVTSVGAEAFFAYSDIRSIEIGNDVTSICREAFAYCTGLTAVFIPDNVTNIDFHAFSACTSLSEIVVDEGNAAYCGVDGVLFSNDMDTLLCYPAGNTRTEYAIPDGVTVVDSYAFERCNYLVAITIPDSVTKISRGAFSSCAALTSIDIPASVTKIDVFAFGSCASLSEIVVDESNAAYCSVDGVLFSKDEATLLCYPAGNTQTEYVIPGGVTVIAERALMDCGHIVTVSIPDSVTEIGRYAFESTNLATVYYSGTETQWDEITIGTDNDPLLSAEIIFAEPELEVIASGECGTEGDNLTWTLTEDGTLTISGEGAMADYFFAISDYAPWYTYCEQITTVIVGDGVSHIGAYAFYKCSNLTSVDITDDVTSIGVGAFQYCTSLVSVTIPDNVTSIKPDAFAFCYSLTSVTIPDSVTGIGEGVFSNCSSLLAISVSHTNPNYCSVDGVLFSKDMKTLIAYPAGKTETAYEIPDSVATICRNVFYGCLALTSVTIPNSVVDIGSGAFYVCSSLTTVYYSGTEEQWNAIAIGDYNEPLLNAEIVFAEDSIVLGDVNGDGKVSGADTNLIFRYVSGLIEFTDEQLAAADVNGDGKVSGADTNLVFRFVSGMLDSLG